MLQGNLNQLAVLSSSEKQIRERRRRSPSKKGEESKEFILTSRSSINAVQPTVKNLNKDIIDIHFENIRSIRCSLEPPNGANSARKPDEVNKKADEEVVQPRGTTRQNRKQLQKGLLKQAMSHSRAKMAKNGHSRSFLSTQQLRSQKSLQQVNTALTTQSITCKQSKQSKNQQQVKHTSTEPITAQTRVQTGNAAATAASTRKNLIRVKYETNHRCGEGLSKIMRTFPRSCSQENVTKVFQYAGATDEIYPDTEEEEQLLIDEEESTNRSFIDQQREQDGLEVSHEGYIETFKKHSTRLSSISKRNFLRNQAQLRQLSCQEEELEEKRSKQNQGKTLASVHVPDSRVSSGREVFAPIKESGAKKNKALLSQMKATGESITSIKIANDQQKRTKEIKKRSPLKSQKENVPHETGLAKTLSILKQFEKPKQQQAEQNKDKNVATFKISNGQTFDVRMWNTSVNQFVEESTMTLVRPKEQNEESQLINSIPQKEEAVVALEDSHVATTKPKNSRPTTADIKSETEVQKMSSMTSESSSQYKLRNSQYQSQIDADSIKPLKKRKLREFLQSKATELQVSIQEESQESSRMLLLQSVTTFNDQSNQKMNPDLTFQNQEKKFDMKREPKKMKASSFGALNELSHSSSSEQESQVNLVVKMTEQNSQTDQSSEMKDVVHQEEGTKQVQIVTQQIDDICTPDKQVDTGQKIAVTNNVGSGVSRNMAQREILSAEPRRNKPSSFTKIRKGGTVVTRSESESLSLTFNPQDVQKSFIKTALNTQAKLNLKLLRTQQIRKQQKAKLRKSQNQKANRCSQETKSQQQFKGLYVGGNQHRTMSNSIVAISIKDMTTKASGLNENQSLDASSEHQQTKSPQQLQQQKAKKKQNDSGNQINLVIANPPQWKKEKQQASNQMWRTHDAGFHVKSQESLSTKGFGVGFVSSTERFSSVDGAPPSTDIQLQNRIQMQNHGNPMNCQLFRQTIAPDELVGVKIGIASLPRASDGFEKDKALEEQQALPGHKVVTSEIVSPARSNKSLNRNKTAMAATVPVSPRISGKQSTFTPAGSSEVYEKLYRDRQSASDAWDQRRKNTEMRRDIYSPDLHQNKLNELEEKISMAEASKTNASSRNVYSLTGPDFTSQSRREAAVVTQTQGNQMSAGGDQEQSGTTAVVNAAKSKIVKLDSKPQFDNKFYKPQNAIQFAQPIIRQATCDIGQIKKTSILKKSSSVLTDHKILSAHRQIKTCKPLYEVQTNNSKEKESDSNQDTESLQPTTFGLQIRTKSQDSTQIDKTTDQEMNKTVFHLPVWNGNEYDEQNITKNKKIISQRAFVSPGPGHYDQNRNNIGSRHQQSRQSHQTQSLDKSHKKSAANQSSELFKVIKTRLKQMEEQQSNVPPSHRNEQVGPGQYETDQLSISKRVLSHHTSLSRAVFSQQNPLKRNRDTLAKCQSLDLTNGSLTSGTQQGTNQPSFQHKKKRLTSSVMVTHRQRIKGSKQDTSSNEMHQTCSSFMTLKDRKKFQSLNAEPAYVPKMAKTFKPCHGKFIYTGKLCSFPTKAASTVLKQTNLTSSINHTSASTSKLLALNDANLLRRSSNFLEMQGKQVQPIIRAATFIQQKKNNACQGTMPANLTADQSINNQSFQDISVRIEADADNILMVDNNQLTDSKLFHADQNQQYQVISVEDQGVPKYCQVDNSYFDANQTQTKVPTQIFQLESFANQIQDEKTTNRTQDEKTKRNSLTAQKGATTEQRKQEEMKDFSCANQDRSLIVKLPSPDKEAQEAQVKALRLQNQSRDPVIIFTSATEAATKTIINPIYKIDPDCQNLKGSITAKNSRHMASRSRVLSPSTSKQDASSTQFNALTKNNRNQKAARRVSFKQNHTKNSMSHGLLINGFGSASAERTAPAGHVQVKVGCCDWNQLSCIPSSKVSSLYQSSAPQGTFKAFNTNINSESATAKGFGGSATMTSFGAFSKPQQVKQIAVQDSKFGSKQLQDQHINARNNCNQKERDDFTENVQQLFQGARAAAASKEVQ